MEGKFIVFEGLDKSGKETQAKKLVDYLNSKGLEAIYTEEPNPKNPIGLLIKEWLNKKLEIKSGESIALLYTADRLEHLKSIIEPNLKEGKIVICDRYFYSTIAYESSLYGVDKKWIRDVNKFARKPDLVIFIDTNPEECIKRKREEPDDRHEKLEIQKKVRKAYLELAKEEKFFVVDGNREMDKVFEDVKKITESFLKI